MNDIKERIAKLLALAESPNENEAKAALLKARRLMAEHKLELREIKSAHEPELIRRTAGITYTKMTNAWASVLAAVIAENYCCRSFIQRVRGAKRAEIGFIGLSEDFGVCEKIFRYTYDFVCAQCALLRRQNEHCDAKQQRGMANAYGFGFCSGLKAAFAEQQKQHQNWGLVLTVPKAVEDEVSKLRKSRGYAPDLSGGNAAAAMKGFSDGKNFDVLGGAGKRLAG